MIMVVIIVSGLHCKAEALTSGNKQADAGIINIPVSYRCGGIIIHDLPVMKGVQQSVVKAETIGFLPIDFLLSRLEVPGGKAH